MALYDVWNIHKSLLRTLSNSSRREKAKQLQQILQSELVRETRTMSQNNRPFVYKANNLLFLETPLLSPHNFQKPWDNATERGGSRQYRRFLWAGIQRKKIIFPGWLHQYGKKGRFSRGVDTLVDSMSSFQWDKCCQSPNLA